MRLRRNLSVLLLASAGLLSAPFPVSAQDTAAQEFASLGHTDEFISAPAPYREGDFTVTSSVIIGSPMSTVFGPDNSRFTGSAALTSGTVPVTATITNDNNDAFDSIEVSEFNPQGCRGCMNPP
ncbi:MAG: hypothetical protein ACE5LB_16020 [Acidiferrobacterales bacterium]